MLSAWLMPGLLYAHFLKKDWALRFDWDGWASNAQSLGKDHPMVARTYEMIDKVVNDPKTHLAKPFLISIVSFWLSCGSLIIPQIRKEAISGGLTDSLSFITENIPLNVQSMQLFQRYLGRVTADPKLLLEKHNQANEKQAQYSSKVDLVKQSNGQIPGVINRQLFVTHFTMSPRNPCVFSCANGAESGPAICRPAPRHRRSGTSVGPYCF